MSFQKRSVPLRRTPAPASNPLSAAASARGPATPLQTDHAVPNAVSQPHQSQPPAPKQAAQTVPTGTATLDTLLARPAGLPVGSILLILEGGATDYSGALVRCSAAEGILRGETVHVVGCDPTWGRSLPGVAGNSSSSNAPDTSQKKGASEREMKIAWRYERLGNNTRDTTSSPAAQATQHASHTFDLTKRLDLPRTAQVHYHALDHNPAANPFGPALSAITHALTRSTASTPSQPHRILLPSLLSPALYPATASHPAHLIPFLHALRALLRRPGIQATATASLPTALHARLSAPNLTLHWAEHLADAVIELAPFPHRLGGARPVAGATGGAADEEPQGLLRVRTVPGLHERGVGGAAPGLRLGEDWAFVMGRRRFDVRAYTLPVEEDDGLEASGVHNAGGMPSKAEMEF